MITNFKAPSYLANGNARQQQAFHTLQELKIFKKLATFDPVLTGTVPIEVDIPTSDLDIICQFQDEVRFKTCIESQYSTQPNFFIQKTRKQEQNTIIAYFRYQGYEIEIFGQPLPVHKQMAYRHMIKEYEILQSKGPAFRSKVIELKREGLSTEAAFAQLLGIKGDPYLALLYI